MKKFWAISVAVVMVVSMTACGTKATGGKENSERDSVKSESIQAESKAGAVNETKEKAENAVSSAVVDAGLDELEEIVMADVEAVIESLNAEYESLLSEVDTYESYLKNKDTVAAFYDEVYSETSNLCIRLQEYSVSYANVIIASDKTTDEKYEDLELIYDCVYEEARDDIYDSIYEDLMEQVYDDIYDGILEDAYDTAEYKEWSDARSDEYEYWSDTRSEVYEVWSDCGSDIYEFWSDLRSEVWSDDLEKALEKVSDFVEDIEKLKGKSTDKADASVATEEKKSESAGTEKTDASKESDAGLVDGMRPEFKEAMDSYEAFYKKYCEMLKKYNSNPTDMSILKEYTELMGEADEMNEKFEAWEDGELNDAETAYYVEVNGRVSKMILEVSGL